MAKDVVCLKTVSNMEDIRKALITKHNAFPIRNVAGKPVGLIPKHVLCILLEQKQFYCRDQIRTGSIVDNNMMPTATLPGGGQPAPSTTSTSINDRLLQEDKNARASGLLGRTSDFNETFMANFDADQGFPVSEGALPWTHFNADVHSSEANPAWVL